MALIITDAILQQAQLTEEELLIELACYMYQNKKLSMGKARELVKMNQMEFQKELAARDIDIHYTEEDLFKDLENLDIKL